MKAVQGHRFEAIYTVTLFTGLRQGEVLGLTWDCIDFENGVIVVNKQLQKEKEKGGKFYFTTLKNDKVRRIAPADYVMRLLFAHKGAQLAMKRTAGQAWDSKDNLVFTNELSDNLVHGTVYKNFKRIVDGIGAPAARFHDLRHSYAVAAFTLDVYGHVTERMKKESAARMDAYIKNVQNL
ncbi:MAG: site-specific integrase [Oscillospiraceae bacterium]|nr:site-specific integrase [Oscillospiraceae bacterium]